MPRTSKATMDHETHRARIIEFTHVLNIEAERRNMTRQDLCAHLGVTTGYYATLMAGGSKNQVSVGRPIIDGAAELLDTSPLNVMMMIGMVTPADLYAAVDTEAALDRAYKMARSDPSWGPYMPNEAEFAALSTASRLGQIFLVQAATQRILLGQLEILLDEGVGSQKAKAEAIKERRVVQEKRTKPLPPISLKTKAASEDKKAV